MMFVGRISLPQLSALVLIGLIGGSAFVMSSPERQSRITSYVTQITEINNVRLDQNDGYQAQQAHIAIAQGEFFGVGIGKSTQRDFLPAPYNDFIFAIIAEEYGLAGAAFVLAIFTLIMVRGIAITARHAPDVLGTMLALGATLFLTIYALVNACVATGLFPVTGLPMPFISYGGTSIIFAAIMTGILLNISKYNTNLKSRFFNG
jgi:cell division protein FtsW